MNGRVTTTTIGDIVAADFRTAAVFERYGIDFCCGGGRPFEEACRSAAVDPADVERALDALDRSDGAENDVTAWSIDRLIDHIVSTHHAYVRTAMPAIQGYLARLIQAHGARHPELVRVASVFELLSADLEQHLMKEEMVLFPYARELARTDAGGRHVLSPFGTVENPIRMMEREHRDAAEGLRAMRELTNGFVPPDDGCTTYAVCMAELARFERDLHRHVHLENNVLFPRTIDIENGRQTR
jgi:regulator of cell morphogenesis and NO signaling